MEKALRSAITFDTERHSSMILFFSQRRSKILILYNHRGTSRIFQDFSSVLYEPFLSKVRTTLFAQSFVTKVTSR